MIKKVWFYEIANDGYDPDKVVGGGRAETPERNDIPDLHSQWRTYRRSGFKKPPGSEAIGLLDPDSKTPKSWWADIKVLGANAYSLAAGRYKPQIAEAAPKEDPAQLICEVLHLEREITRGLEHIRFRRNILH